MPVEKVGESPRHAPIDLVRGRHEVGPVEERAGHGQAVLAQDGQLGADGIGVVVPPHGRPRNQMKTHIHQVE
jgi:hypothetical protein